jgi:hypothetical protein
VTAFSGLFQRLSGGSELGTDHVNRVSNRVSPEQKLEMLPALGVIRVGLLYCDCLKVIIPWLWYVYVFSVNVW